MLAYICDMQQVQSQDWACDLQQDHIFDVIRGRLTVRECVLRQVEEMNHNPPGTQNEGSKSREPGDGADHSKSPRPVGITGVEDEPPGMTPDPNLIPSPVEDSTSEEESEPDSIPNVLPSGD